MGGEDDDGEECGQYEEGCPGLDHGSTAHILTLDQHQHRQAHHVPVLTVLVPHHVESCGHVTVTVVTTQVMHST